VSDQAASAHASRLRRLKRLAFLLDDSIPIPILNRRIGLDSVIGLVPVAGDLVGGALSVYIVYSGHRLGASAATLLRMAGNVAVEMVLGAVPLLGDLFDMGFKANQRNVRLLEDHARDSESVERHSRWWTIGVFGSVAAMLLGAVLLTVAVAIAAVRALAGLF
jgi:hypothetical protein